MLGICRSCKIEFSQNPAPMLRASSRALQVAMASQSYTLHSITHLINRFMRSKTMPASEMNCLLMLLNSLSEGRSTPPSRAWTIRDTLWAYVQTFSLTGDLMHGDLFNSRKQALSFGFMRRSLNSVACDMMLSLQISLDLFCVGTTHNLVHLSVFGNTQKQLHCIELYQVFRHGLAILCARKLLFTSNESCLLE